MRHPAASTIENGDSTAVRGRARGRRHRAVAVAGWGLALCVAWPSAPAQTVPVPATGASAAMSGGLPDTTSMSMPSWSGAGSGSTSGAGASGGGAKFLIPIVMAAMTPALQAGLGCVFDRLFSFMGSNPSPACVQPNQTAVVKPGDGAALAVAPPNAAPMSTGPASAEAPNPAAQAQLLAATPVLSFIVNKLSDGTPQATVTQTVQFADVKRGGAPLGFDIRTGEAFAILFSTSVPGRVRLINTDAKQNVAVSDVYEAMPAADNRMPRDWQGGITMAGDKGVEYLDVEFTPCLSPRYAADPRIAMFQGLLTACSPEAATKRFLPARARGGGGPAEAGAKAMVFPGSPSPGQPIALAPGDYAKGDGLTFRITIDHR